jgi:Uma2 family endonuclease
MNTISLDLGKRYSYADYLTWIDDKCRELIDGFVKMMSAPKLVHQSISGNLYISFSIYIRKNKGSCKVYHNIDVRLPVNGEKENGSIYNVVQPDISIICDKSKLDERGCLGAPDMVIEIQSRSTANYDVTKKLKLYERSGVKEYWVVYPKTKEVSVFLLQDNGKYGGKTVYKNGKIPVSIFDGCFIELEDIFNN